MRPHFPESRLWGDGEYIRGFADDPPQPSEDDEGAAGVREPRRPIAPEGGASVETDLVGVA